MMADNARVIYCIGIGGIGVSALASFWHAQGKEVSGSDAQESEITKALEQGGIQVNVGTLPTTHYPLPTDLVVYSDAVPEDHPERIFARAAGIPELSYGQALGQVSLQYRTIVVTGTHGKSTTTAMLGLIAEAAGLDPLVIVGSKVPEWGNSNIRIPRIVLLENYSNDSLNSQPEAFVPSFFVVEGDDYRDHFLELHPYAVVVTSIEHDHPDYFRDLNHTIESFRALIEKVPKEGFVLLNDDDPGCKRLARSMSHSPIRPKRRMTTYGRASDIFSKLQLKVLGEFNRYNATAAATAAQKLGVSDDVIQKAFGEFKGIWRRFEIVGTLHTTDYILPTVTILSDYAHHPTAIRETMKAAREFYKDQRLVLVYQPHQHSRTKRLFSDFVDVLKNAADVLILSEIYAVKGRMEDRDINSQMLVDEITRPALPAGRLRNCEIANVLYGGDLEQTKQVVLEQIRSGDVVIFMGAGDIDEIARELVR